MEQERIVHRRFVSDSKPFILEIEKLGFKELSSIGFGLNKMRRFQKEHRFIDTGYHGLRLYIKNEKGEEDTSYTGLTVHDEMLIFFATRTLKTIDDEK